MESNRGILPGAGEKGHPTYGRFAIVTAAAPWYAQGWFWPDGHLPYLPSPARGRHLTNLTIHRRTGPAPAEAPRLPTTVPPGAGNVRFFPRARRWHTGGTTDAAASASAPIRGPSSRDSRPPGTSGRRTWSGGRGSTRGP